MGRAEGFDHQCRGTGGQWRRLAGSTEFCRSVGLPASLLSRQSGKLASHTAQFESAGATRSMVRPYWVKPEEEKVAMLLFSQWPFEKALAPAPLWMYDRLVVVAPTEMTAGSVASGRSFRSPRRRRSTP